MNKIPFDEKELTVVDEIPSFGGTTIPIFDFPITPREAAIRYYRDHDPVWMPMGVETTILVPPIIPDNIARGAVREDIPWTTPFTKAKDMFGVEWVYVPTVGGAMENPENPHLMDDVNDWEEKIIFPDIESWDWTGSAERNVKIRSTGRANMLMFLNGMGFERLISFMGFEDAAMALLDEDQEDALHGLLHALTDLHIAMVDKGVEYYHIDGVNLHDDWGSQQAPFFSEEAGRKFFMPEMKRFNDHVHELGLFSDLHSCGHIEDRCNLLVEAGFDAWTPMPMNNTAKLYDDYGDKMAIATVTDMPFDPETASEEEQREAARWFVERYTQSGKLAFFSNYNKPGQMTRAFREEMYKASREAYARE